MEFSKGSKVRVTDGPLHLGRCGVVVGTCNIISYCRKVEFEDDCVYHVFTDSLTLIPTKNQQLLFDFMK